MHPNKFFNEVSCRTGLDIVEIFDSDLKEKLKNVHPKNFLKTKISLPVFKIVLDYDTENGNHKSVERYMVMDSKDEEEYSDFWADTFCRDYNDNHPQHKMLNCNITNIEHICDAVLPIG